MIKILIADDHAIVREGLKQIISETPDMAVVAEASNGEDVLEKVSANKYDVILLDISMPGRSGLDILRQLKIEKPKLPIMMLSVHPEEQYAVRALRAGASGYLTKESAPDELIAAIRKISQGRKYVSSSLAEKLAYELGIDVKKLRHEVLSDREFQVMCMFASGKTVKEIAAELSISIPTIRTYRIRILEKMKMKNIAEIIHYAVKQGLVD
ncbi:MAG: DNA-binding response regulator [Thermodesulfovibrio sp. RBG_19FT_COMBO_42_12]|jgi:two-component system invasion response regulator UvrY|nr:MAG: DNA-binding response regulator [Thermodesulfovibrio sp. RBG_19FT_COMBO_42_12]